MISELDNYDVVLLSRYVDGGGDQRSKIRVLSSKIINNQNEEETNERLKTWTTVGHDRPYGKYALAGATAGMEFGLSRRSDLRLINNFEWLREKFDE